MRKVLPDPRRIPRFREFTMQEIENGRLRISLAMDDLGGIGDPPPVSAVLLSQDDTEPKPRPPNRDRPKRNGLGRKAPESKGGSGTPD